MLKIPSISEAEKLIEEKLGGWFDVVISHIPNFIVAVMIAIVFSILARFLGSMMRNLLRRSLDSKQIADLMASIFKVLILCVGLFIALDFMGLKGTVTSLLAGAGIVGLAIGFAFQDKQMTDGFEAMLPASEQMASQLQLDDAAKEELKNIYRDCLKGYNLS